MVSHTSTPFKVFTQLTPSPFGDLMPFKSEAQKAMFKQMVKDGKMSQAVYDKWEAETPNTPLPKKASYKPKGQVRGVRRVK